MNSSEPLPQIVPPPDFPVPETSRLSRLLAGNMYDCYRMSRAQNRVYKLYRSDYWGTFLSMQNQKVALFLQSSQGTCYLYLAEPEEKKGISRKSLFDRFNALLIRGKLPTLHFISKNCWVFSDGIPWVGRRTFKFQRSIQTPELVVLRHLLTFPP